MLHRLPVADAGGSESGHQVARAPEVLERRVGEEVRDARRVDAGVLLDLIAEAGGLVRLLEQRAPVRVEASGDLALELADLRVDGPELAADALDGALGAAALGLEERRREVDAGPLAVPPPAQRRPRRSAAGGPCWSRRRRSFLLLLLDLAGQVLVALLVVAQLVLELSRRASSRARSPCARRRQDSWAGDLRPPSPG